jgi:UDP-N-acetylmuramoyl-L-alanyl-D-glutamate--2,6-diaminopimelate ligase
VIFTNCTPEHLDFFNNYEEYKQVKISAFSNEKAKIAIVNADDIAGKEIICLRKSGVISYGLDDPCDIFAIDFYENKDGINFLMNLFDELYQINSCYFGRHNVYNMLAAASACAIAGVNIDFIAQQLRSSYFVDGRMEKVCNKINVFIDYAHTPDGLEKVLDSLKSVKEDKRLICVFGCGGNRDKEKRALMGEIAAKKSDFTILTSDNPRYEDPLDILSEIEKGYRRFSVRYVVVPDRKKGLEYALDCLNKGDVLLIAGKGAEEYQEIMGIKYPFKDQDIIEKLLKKNG